MQCFLELCHHSNKLYKKMNIHQLCHFSHALAFLLPSPHVSLSVRHTCLTLIPEICVLSLLSRCCCTQHTIQVSRVTSATQKLPVFGMTRPSAQTGTDSMLKKLLSRNKFAPLLRTVSPGTHHCLRPGPRETNSESLTFSNYTTE